MDEATRVAELEKIVARFDAGDTAITMDVYDSACDELAELGAL